MADPDELARVASEMVDAWCAANPAPAWPALPDDVSAVDLTTVWSGTLEHDPASGETRAWASPRREPVKVAYTTVRDQARAIVGEDDELQQRIGDLVTAGASGAEARAAIEAIVEYALRKGIVGV